MSTEVSYRYLKDESTRERLFDWWESLKDNRGDRARLRRAELPDDALLTEAFFHFLAQMPTQWSAPEELSVSAMVAATLSHVKQHRNDKSFAESLATPKEGGDKPRMSELRFQQLQKSRDPETFFKRFLRAIRMLESTANIYSVTDNILHWMQEYRHGLDREPFKRLAVRWANDYYTSLPKH